MAKRAPKKYPRPEGVASVTKVYPWFFWKTCSKCNQEFRREYVWMVNVHRWLPPGIQFMGSGYSGTFDEKLWRHYGYEGQQSRYVCFDCASTADKARELCSNEARSFCATESAPKFI